MGFEFEYEDFSMMEFLAIFWTKRPSFYDEALCRDRGKLNLFFPTIGKKAKSAIQICERCDVRYECLEYAINENMEEGVWGGTKQDERLRWKARKLTVEEIWLNELGLE
jgi:WhiB family transcriptional regulator, redox-sensing transcriptional regulator